MTTSKVKIFKLHLFISCWLVYEIAACFCYVLVQRKKKKNLITSEHNFEDELAPTATKMTSQVTCSLALFSPAHSKKEGKDQESIQPSTTPDQGYQWESNNVTIRHHKREPRGQLFPSM